MLSCNCYIVHKFMDYWLGYQNGHQDLVVWTCCTLTFRSEELLVWSAIRVHPEVCACWIRGIFWSIYDLCNPCWHADKGGRASVQLLTSYSSAKQMCMWHWMPAQNQSKSRLKRQSLTEEKECNVFNLINNNRHFCGLLLPVFVNRNKSGQVEQYTEVWEC